MNKFLSLFLLTGFFSLNAQETVNRFFYELNFKPQRGIEKIEKVMTILDITKDKSIYRDYTLVAQDSIMKVQFEGMQKSGTFKDLSKMVVMPKFSEKVYKLYPEMKVQYVEKITSGMSPLNIGYNDDYQFNWNIENEKMKIGSYNTQKATADFGGRRWIAWFSANLPLQDGPYKFHGLPGLIVKIEDEDKNYSWELKGNKEIPNFSEATYLETVMPGGNGGKVQELSREKFTKTLTDYKKDPFASLKPMMTPQMLSQKMPGSDITMGEMFKQKEKSVKDFFGANSNPIEIEAAGQEKKK